ncbi:MAG: tetratricopeptide repeat protein [Kofleriaceae bacterium]
MRALFVVAILASPAFAGPKSSLPPQIAKAARDAFAAARAADEKGDLKEAIKQYERAYAISPHPFALYNIADLHRRNKHIEGAVQMFEKYLESPDVKDRAAVEKTIRELKAIPGTLDIDYDEPGGIVFIDGKRVGTLDKKTSFDVPSGTHVVDVITPITHGDGVCTVAAGRDSTCQVSGKPREDGNVVLSGRWPMGGLSWPVKHADGESVRLLFRGRAVAKPGHYPDLKVMDKQCKPVPLDVPKGDAVLFGYITYPDRADSSACYDLTLTLQRVSF